MAFGKKEKKAGHMTPKISRQQQAMICDGLSFAASEAYKLLRTNLSFTLPEKSCQILGVTSSIRGEGKSTTSVNLAYTFAQAGKKVLLIDADMRLPSISNKLAISGIPGLSNVLAGLSEEKDARRVSRYFSNWHILPAGDIPPNPSELLGSERMHALLERYSQVFDVIILDLPPVNIVADALVISKWTDGLVLVVRQNYSDKKSLDDCMYQIEKLQVKFLGFVMTASDVGETAYKRYGKYGRASRYGYGYGYSEPSSDGKNEKAFIDAAASEGKQVPGGTGSSGGGDRGGDFWK